MGNSDHMATLLDVKVRKNDYHVMLKLVTGIREIKMVKKNVLSNVRWNVVLRIKPEGVWLAFDSKVRELRDQYIPIKLCNSNSNSKSKWLTAKLKSARQYDFERYKKAKKQAKKVVRQGKR